MQMKQLRKYKLFLSQNKMLMAILFKQVLRFFFRLYRCGLNSFMQLVLHRMPTMWF